MERRYHYICLIINTAALILYEALASSASMVATPLTLGQTAPTFEQLTLPRQCRRDFLHKRTNSKSSIRRTDLAASYLVTY